MSPPSIRFCEPSYIYTDYIAEWYNTWSSSSYVVVGLLYLITLYRQASDYYTHFWCKLWIGVNIIAVGIGSILFHATQQFEMELMDELPMLTLMLALFYLAIDTHQVLSKPDIKCPILVLVLASVGCTTYQYIITRNYDWFLHPFALMLLCVIAIDCHTRVQKQLGWSSFQKPATLLCVSQIAWQTEQWMVRQHIQNHHCYWLHSMWHICSALSIWLWLL